MRALGTRRGSAPGPAEGAAAEPAHAGPPVDADNLGDPRCCRRRRAIYHGRPLMYGALVQVEAVKMSPLVDNFYSRVSGLRDDGAGFGMLRRQPAGGGMGLRSMPSRRCRQVRSSWHRAHTGRARSALVFRGFCRELTAICWKCRAELDRIIVIEAR